MHRQSTTITKITQRFRSSLTTIPSRVNHLAPNVVMFPSWKGQRTRGVEQTPAHIVDINDVHPGRRFPVWCGDGLQENLRSLYDTDVALLEDSHSHHEASAHGPLINVGGDHSMAIATVAATLRVHPDARVLWVDAHPDLNTLQASRTKNYHGMGKMPLAYLSGLDWPFAQDQFPYITEANRLDLSDKLMYVGIRDVDEFEARMIAKHRIPFVSVHDLRTNLHGSLTKILEWVNGYPVHLSFDVDAIDPGELPSTGTPVPDGLSTRHARMIVESLRLKARVVNVDITELNLHVGTVEDRSRSLAAVSRVFADYFHPVQRLG